jgi:hypothetical protein
MGKEEELDEEASRESLGCGPGVGLLGGRGPVEVSVRCTRNSTARDPVGHALGLVWWKCFNEYLRVPKFLLAQLR